MNTDNLHIEVMECSCKTGSTLDNCSRDAVILALQNSTDVRFVLNGINYFVGQHTVLLQVRELEKVCDNE